MESPTEHEAELSAMRKALLTFITEQFKDKPADMLLTVLVTITVQMGMTISQAEDPKAALVSAVMQIADIYEQQHAPPPIIRH